MTTLREAAEVGMKPDQLTQDLAMIARNAINYIIKLERERDALLEALKAMLTHMGMDEDEWNKPTFDQARAAIKAVEGEKT